jgi:hypothetical protein
MLLKQTIKSLVSKNVFLGIARTDNLPAGLPAEGMAVRLKKRILKLFKNEL